MSGKSWLIVETGMKRLLCRISVNSSLILPVHRHSICRPCQKVFPVSLWAILVYVKLINKVASEPLGQDIWYSEDSESSEPDYYLKKDNDTDTDDEAEEANQNDDIIKTIEGLWWRQMRRRVWSRVWGDDEIVDSDTVSAVIFSKRPLWVKR